MAIYTFDQFQKAARDAGLYDQFSTADLSLAQKNPDAGMSILKYKQDYAKATTDEARALANSGAEGIRSSYGNYTGGKDGSGFALDPLTASSFTAPEKPTFSYSADTDPLYAQYVKTYKREGDRAMSDAIGTAAAATGGIPSSYAMTAATQAGDYYAAQMADKVPELYEMAYNRYLNELDQYNADREFGYAQLLDEISQQRSERGEAIDMATLAADVGDYRFLQDMGIDTTNNPVDWERLYAMAQLGAEMGDNSYLEQLGITAPQQSAQKVQQSANETQDETGEKLLPTNPEAVPTTYEGAVKMLKEYGASDEVIKGLKKQLSWETGAKGFDSYEEYLSDYVLRAINGKK